MPQAPSVHLFVLESFFFVSPGSLSTCLQYQPDLATPCTLNSLHACSSLGLCFSYCLVLLVKILFKAQGPLVLLLSWCSLLPAPLLTSDRNKCLLRNLLFVTGNNAFCLYLSCLRTCLISHSGQYISPRWPFHHLLSVTLPSSFQSPAHCTLKCNMHQGRIILVSNDRLDVFGWVDKWKISRVSESLEGLVKTDRRTPPPNIQIQVVLGGGREFAFPTNSQGMFMLLFQGPSGIWEPLIQWIYFLGFSH